MLVDEFTSKSWKSYEMSSMNFFDKCDYGGAAKCCVMVVCRFLFCLV